MQWYQVIKTEVSNHQNYFTITDAEASCITNEMAFLIQLLPYKSWLMPVSRPDNCVALSFCYEKKTVVHVIGNI